MARYNTSSSTNTITGAATISSPFQGAFTQFSGSAPYTVILPAPGAFPGVNQTFYNATGGVVTVSTPNGAFTGTGGPNASTFAVNSGNVLTVVPDGTNYIVISEDGSPLVATTGSFSGNVSITSGTTSLTPGSFSLTPSSTAGTIDNTNIGATTRGTGAFNALTANQAVTFTAGTASSNSTTGTLVVTGGIGASGNINAGGNVSATNLTGTLSTASQPNITSLGTLTSLTSTGNITVSNTAAGYIWGGSYVISPQGNHIPQATGFLSMTGGVTFPSGWYRISRSAIQSGSSGVRGGAKITVASTGNFLGPLQDVIYLFKDWTTSGQIGRVENYIGSYFSRYRLTMDANYAYLEGFLNSSYTLGGTSGWQVTAEPYSGNWNADNWTVANETLSAGLSSPVASYTIPVSSGGTSIRKLLIDRESEASGTSSPSLEIRVNGGINTGNYDGIFFTQSVDGTTPLGSFRLANKSNGAPDFELWTRNGSTETRRVLFSNDGRLGVDTADFSYTASDNTAVVGSFTNNKLFVNGSIQLLSNNDGIVIGRGTSSFFKDEEIGFGWGSGWWMNDTTYLRVRNNKIIYSTSYAALGGIINTSSVGANSASGNTIGSYVLGNGRWWSTAGGAQYIHFLLPARYNQGNSLMWCIEIKGYDFARPGIINVMIGGYVTPPSNGGPMGQVASWDAQSYYSPTAYYSSNYACGVARIYMPNRYYASFTVNSIASGNGDIIAPDELRIIESASATI